MGIGGHAEVPWENAIGNYVLRITNYGLRITDYELLVTGFGRLASGARRLTADPIAAASTAASIAGDPVFVIRKS
jgi:chromosome condensin MukBEF complex kleisin-like MukF subunit